MGVWAGLTASLTTSVSVLLAFVRLVNKNGNWKGSVDTGRSTFRTFMEEIRHDSRGIKDKLSDTLSAIVIGSPPQLSEYDRKLTDSLEAEHWAEKAAICLLW